MVGRKALLLSLVTFVVLLVAVVLPKNSTSTPGVATTIVNLSTTRTTLTMSANGAAANEHSDHQADKEMLSAYSQSLSGKHILVPGGAGYIGSHTVLELLNVGSKVTVVDNLVNSNEESLRRVEKLTGKKVTFINADLTDIHQLEDRVFKGQQYDAVILFASLKAVGESMQQPLRYHANNVAGAINLLQCCDKYNVKDFVFSSSATVYGAATKMPITEDFPLGSTNPYGQTKYIIELILRDIANSPVKEGQKPWRIILLRYFNPIGAHSSGQIGEDPLGIPNNLVPYVAQVAAQWPDRPHVTVYGDDWPTPDGTGVRDYIHVVDLARGHLAALAEGVYQHKDTSKSWSEAYNLGSGHGYSVKEVIAAYSKACGRQVPYKVGPRRGGDTAECYADPAKAYNELKWKATHTLQEAIDSSWKWQSQNPKGFGRA